MNEFNDRATDLYLSTLFTQWKESFRHRNVRFDLPTVLRREQDTLLTAWAGTLSSDERKWLQGRRTCGCFYGVREWFRQLLSLAR